MQNDIAIKVESLTKIYHLYDKPQDRFKEALHPFRKSYHHDFYAVNDISFEIKKGETVGIIGKNGAGKSTLLKMITGVLTPTSGSIQVNGKIASLLELGAGFNPEMTGLENIYLNGTLMGFSQQEMEPKIDAILEFADIGEFIHQPVKNYSSGMFVRLAFAVNIVSKPEIMIVDEALAVGDMNFQAKCMTALTRLQESGTTILFVSHDIGSVKSLCSRGIYIDQGKVSALGSAPDIAELYMKNIREEMNAEIQQHNRKSVDFEKIASLEDSVLNKHLGDIEFKRSDEFEKRVASFRYGSGGVKITYAELLNEDNNVLQTVGFNQKIKIRIYIESKIEKSISVSFNILDDKKVNVTGSGFAQVEQEPIEVRLHTRHLFEYSLYLPLKPGVYSLLVQVTSPVIVGKSAEFIDVIDNAVVFQVQRWEKAMIWSSIHLFPELKLKYFGKTE